MLWTLEKERRCFCLGVAEHDKVQSGMLDEISLAKEQSSLSRKDRIPQNCLLHLEQVVPESSTSAAV